MSQEENEEEFLSDTIISTTVKMMSDAISLRRIADIKSYIKTLKQQNADIAKLSRDNLWIIEAAKTGIVDVVEYLVDSGIDLNVEVNGMNAIHAAHDYSRIVQILIANNLNINATDTEYGNTPLCYAILRKNVKTALLLMEAGADINKANGDGNTPLLLAAGSDRYEQIQIF
jgi:ankyrin repeat protein